MTLVVGGLRIAVGLPPNVSIEDFIGEVIELVAAAALGLGAIGVIASCEPIPTQG